MSRGITLAPCGLIIERVESEAVGLLIVARPAASTATCPACGRFSTSIHSRYQRLLSDLPCQGQKVRITVSARRFRCQATDCRRKIFAERLDTAAPRPFARRTARLEGLVHHLGLALGGRPGQSFARRLMLPVSNDTLLRVVRRHATVEVTMPRVIGIDDWAWKRGHRYGTIVCDLERHRIIDLLPDREAATVAAWLAEHPSIQIIARDRGAGYRQAATDGCPSAVQVADRWHLMENASAAFLGAVRRSMGAIRTAMGGRPVDPAALTAAQRKQHIGWLRREEENAAILGMAKAGATIKDLVRKTGRSRGLVRKILRGARGDIFRTRMNSLEPFIARLETAWANGERNGAALWRTMRREGFRGGLRVVTEWMTRKRKECSGSAVVGSRTAPSARSIAKMMTTERGQPSDIAARILAVIDKAAPDLGVARNLLNRFHGLIRGRNPAGLDGWITDAETGLMSSFAAGIVQDVAAVRVALTEPWSNGQTEGQNTKLKLVKRQMYGRAKLDLLRARLIGAT